MVDCCGLTNLSCGPSRRYTHERIGQTEPGSSVNIFAVNTLSGNLSLSLFYFLENSMKFKIKRQGVSELVGALSPVSHIGYISRLVGSKL